VGNAASDHGTPRKILLATDLSARGDRALERALSLCVGWNAELVIVHALEDTHDPPDMSRRPALPSWHGLPDAVSVARRRIAQGLRADLGERVGKAAVFVAEGEPAEVIERIAAGEACDLIITGTAREQPFVLRPYTLGKTVDRLLRRSTIPILVVRNRARSAYEHIVAATDFSDSSAVALQVALRFFPLQRLALLHAYEAPYQTLLTDPARYQDAHHQDQYRGSLERELEAFLAKLSLPHEDRRRIDPLIEFGRPESLFRDYVFHHDADLVVFGTYGHHAVFEALIGSTAKGIASMLPCDALIVPRAIVQNPA